MRELWADGLPWMVSNVQELAGGYAHDDALCGEVAGAGIVEHECLGQIEA